MPCCQICNFDVHPPDYLQKNSFVFFGLDYLCWNFRDLDVCVFVHVCPVMKNMLIIPSFGTDWSLCVHATTLQFLKPNWTASDCRSYCIFYSWVCKFSGYFPFRSWYRCLPGVSSCVSHSQMFCFVVTCTIQSSFIRIGLPSSTAWRALILFVLCFFLKESLVFHLNLVHQLLSTRTETKYGAGASFCSLFWCDSNHVTCHLMSRSLSFISPWLNSPKNGELESLCLL